jgi:hypothetical protein
MTFVYYYIFIVCFGAFGKEKQIEKVNKLIKAYPYQNLKYFDNKIVFSDGTILNFDDFKNKSLTELYENSDIEDQFYFKYNTSDHEFNTDAGRLRNELFFKKMYGHDAKEVQKNLVEITWCPKLVNQKIWVSKVNRVDSVFVALSKELDKYPEFKKFLQKPAGTFQLRLIAGTQRISTHSFGITIDINLKYSNYWQWDCKCQDENKPLKYINRIPIKLVKIFEKHGFIWGGRWLHYDTMHFEYRPELLIS